MSVVDLSGWQKFLDGIPQAHLLQTAEWGELKADFGWIPVRILQGDLGAQVLFQELPLGLKVAYIPRGPICPTGPYWQNAGWGAFQAELDQLCREQGAVFLKLEPDGWEGDPPGLAGYQTSTHSIQPPRTILVSLEGGEEAILNRMKSKTRYNIRLAARKGVSSTQIEDLEPFYELLEGTSERADFGIHTRSYYQKVFDLFQPLGECALFMAAFQGEPLASIMVFKRGERSWYFYGASSRRHRELMAPYLVQWEALRWAKAQGCRTYDLWGVPDQDLDVLESQFTQRSDHLWGVYRFKRGFGGQLYRSPGPWDRVYRPALYWMYTLRNRLTAAAQ